MKNIICSMLSFTMMVGSLIASETPCNTFEDIENRDDIETAYVLYRDAFKAGNYDAAFPLWEKAFEAAPAANGKVSYQFDDGIYMYHLKYSKAAETDKKVIFEKIMELYDSKSACYGNAHKNNTRKAFDSYYYFNEYADRNEIFDHFKKCIDSEKLNTPAYVINPFTELLVEKYYEDKSISMEEVQVLVVSILNIIDHAISTNTDNNTWEKVKEYVSTQLALFEKERGFYDCEYYMSKYLRFIDLQKANCTQVDSAQDIARWAGCDESEELVKTFKQFVSTNCKTTVCSNVSEVVVSSCAKEAYEAYEKKEYLIAIDKYTCVLEEQDEFDKKAIYALLISKIYYTLEKPNYILARQWAEKAASFKSGWGEPYIVIGKLYASSAKLCSSGDTFKSQIVTWPAIDMFQKAKSEDPSVSDEANQLINYYSKYMPSYEELFGREIPLGSSYKVGCWININTTVRKAP